jgi:hypothetical protein
VGLSQDRGPAQPQPVFLTQSEMDKVLNSSFSNLATGNKNATEIVNYASLDPTAAAFTLKSTFPFLTGKNKKNTSLNPLDKLEQDQGRFSYLGIALSGNLLDKNYGTLFSKGALNSGVSAQAQYNFACGKRGYTFSPGQLEPIAEAKDALFANYRKNVNALEIQVGDSNFLATRRNLALQAGAAQNRLQKARTNFALLRRRIDSLGSAIQAHPEVTDDYISAQKDLANYQSLFDKARAGLDSLDSARKHAFWTTRSPRQTALDEQLKKDYDSLILKAPFLKMDFLWFTFSAGVGKKSFKTFDATVPFSSQIGSNSLVTYNGGFAVNYIYIDKVKYHTFFFTSSLSYFRDNNLASLSTTEVDQTKKIVNSGGDTTRTITSKINAYTDPVTVYKATNWTSNFYYMVGKDPKGLHLSPAFSFQDNGLTLSNMTVGFIMSFKSANKDQPIVNTEIYITGKDIFNQQKSSNGLWNRSEVGISFTVPVNLFL